jgi:hypothetical protein
MRGLPDPFIRVFLFLWRKLVGWNRDEDRIPISQIKRGARTGRRQVIEATRFWDAVGIFERVSGGRKKTTRYRVNTNLDRDELIARLSTLVSQRNRSPRGTKTGVSQDPPLVSPGYTHEAKSEKEKSEKITKIEPKIYLIARKYSFNSFKAEKGQTPAWTKADDSQLEALFHRKRDLTLEEYQRRWENYLLSTDRFVVSQGLSLKYFSANFDRFLDGPQHGSSFFSRENTRGKPTRPDYSTLEVD